MDHLSASATILLNYAKNHSTDEGYVDLQDYTDLPQNITINACNELLKLGLVSDVIYSDDSIEGIILKSK